MQGFSLPLVAEVIEAVCAAGLMISDPANARGGVGVGLCAPGRSERVRRGREVGHCRSHRRSGGCGRHGRHGSNFLGVAARDRGRRGFSTKFEIVCVDSWRGAREVLTLQI